MSDELRGISRYNDIIKINNNIYIFSLIYSNNIINKINFKFIQKIKIKY